MRTCKRIFKTQSKKRSATAFSLVTVLCSGLIGAMWIAAAYSMLVPLLQQSSAGKQSAMMRTLAEAAVDFVSNDISTCLQASQLSKYDDPDVGLPYNSFALTPLLLGIEDPGNKAAIISVTVKNEYPATEQDSAVYDFQTVPSADAKRQWSMVNAQNVGWRTIEVRVGLGSSASAKAIYRAMMRPDFGGVKYPSSPGNDPRNPFFPSNQVAFGTSGLAIGSNSNISGDIGSNTAPLNVNGSNISITGSLTVNSLKKASSDQVAFGAFDQTGSQPTIKGYVTTNGNSSGFFDGDKPVGDTSDQVKVTMPASNEPGFDSSKSQPINSGSSIDQTSIPPAPAAPSSATDLGSIGLSGDAKLVIRDGPVDIPVGQSLSNMTTGTAFIPPGDYKISSMDVSGNSSIQVSDASNLSQPAAFYVDDLSGGNSAINIGGKGVSNSNSGNMQVWYNGTNPVNLSGVQVTMAVYAPNANVTVTGGPTNFKGALLGSNISVSNANMTFETPTASTSNPSTSGQMMYDVSSDNGKSIIKPHALKRIIWQELTYSDYIKQGNAPF